MKLIIYYAILVFLMLVSAALMATVTTFFSFGRFSIFMTAGAGYSVFYYRKFLFSMFDKISKKKDRIPKKYLLNFKKSL